MAAGAAGGDQKPGHRVGCLRTPGLTYWVVAVRPVRRLLGVTLVSAMALVLSPVHALEQPGRGGSAVERFSDRLQTALNSGSSSAFNTLASLDLQPVLAQRYQRFRQDFPEVTWQVEPSAPTPDGRPTLSLRVRGAAESEGLTYVLEASEQIAIRLQDGRLVEQELLAQQSLLRSGEPPWRSTSPSPMWCSPAAVTTSI